MADENNEHIFPRDSPQPEALPDDEEKVDDSEEKGPYASCNQGDDALNAELLEE